MHINTTYASELIEAGCVQSSRLWHCVKTSSPLLDCPVNHSLVSRASVNVKQAELAFKPREFNFCPTERQGFGLLAYESPDIFRIPLHSDPAV